VTWTCSRCGEAHEGIAFAFATAVPFPYEGIPANERSTRAILGEEQCEIDGKDFFVRARILLPVIDGPEPIFEWGVWVSLSRQNYERVGELWTAPGRENEPDYFCYVCSALPTYPSSTFLLKGRLHTRPVGERPIVELEPTEHPLAREQRDGITMQHIEAIAEHSIHH